MLCHAPGTLVRDDGLARQWSRKSAKGTSSTGRASVSKTEGCGFKSLVPCETTISFSGRSAEKVNGVSDSSAVSSSPKKDPRPGPRRTSLPTFYRQIVAELRKVVYPTQEQLVTYFLVVMVFVLVMMAIVSGLDLGFGKLVFAIFSG
jgi:preprotein translocase subunit SecE